MVISANTVRPNRLKYTWKSWNVSVLQRDPTTNSGPLRNEFITHFTPILCAPVMGALVSSIEERKSKLTFVLPKRCWTSSDDDSGHIGAYRNINFIEVE
mmetsp:Transcript_16808/g.34560  ORF Transcript_16808/g.34560 Transcript_16808/m.34560 type:complete len:99 (-) Transcript_16808:182-478(-)